MSRRTSTGAILRNARGTGLPYAVSSAIDKHWAERKQQRERERQS